MSLGIWIGYASILALSVLYPLIKLWHASASEFVLIKPYFYGVLAGLVLYGLPFYVMMATQGWFLTNLSVWLFVFLLAFLKALLGELGKRAVSRFGNVSMFKYRYYYPLGLGFSTSLLVILFALPLERFIWASRLYVSQGIWPDETIFFAGTTVIGMVHMFVLIVALVEFEVGLTILSGLSRNKNRSRYWWMAFSLSLMGSFFLLYPIASWTIRYVAVLLVMFLGKGLVFRYRESFSKYLTQQNSFRGFK